MKVNPIQGYKGWEIGTPKNALQVNYLENNGRKNKRRV